MPCPADDLRVGRWYVMLQAHNTLPDVSNISMPVVLKPELPHGIPNIILAIDIPWIITWNGHNLSPVDTRRYSFQRTTRAYVNQWLKHSGGIRKAPGDQKKDAYVSSGLFDPIDGGEPFTHSPDEPTAAEKFIQAVGIDKFTPSRCECPRCGGIMLIARDISIDQRVPICPKCGIQGDPVKA